MAKAIWKGAVLAESESGVVVEGNYYFPADSIHFEYFRANDMETVCHWKGTANYYDVVVDGDVNTGAAWTYRTPKETAAQIKDHVAFWRGVVVDLP